MALIDVVNYETNDDEFVYKFPSEDLKIGTQLIVHPAQTAFFVRGGVICDEFQPGTYTLKTENIPILGKLINLPFGKETPFKAEVWYINQLCKLDIKWGTPQPIQLEDPKYGIIVPVRAFGQYGFKVANPRVFFESWIGNMKSFSSEKISQYFKGKLISQLSSVLVQKIARDSISVLDINSLLIEMSTFCEASLNQYFLKYGIELIDFSIMSINIPQDDPSIIKLKEAKDIAARLRIAGRDFYQMERSFDVLESFANNQGASGNMMAMGAGLGIGVGAGKTIGNMAAEVINTSPATPPPIPQPVLFYLYIDGQQVPNQTLQQISQLISQGLVTADTLAWKTGMKEWAPASHIPELSSLFTPLTPVPPQLP